MYANTVKPNVATVFWHYCGVDLITRSCFLSLALKHRHFPHVTSVRRAIVLLSMVLKHSDVLYIAGFFNLKKNKTKILS